MVTQPNSIRVKYIEMKTEKLFSLNILCFYYKMSDVPFCITWQPFKDIVLCMPFTVQLGNGSYTNKSTNKKKNTSFNDLPLAEK